MKLLTIRRRGLASGVLLGGEAPIIKKRGLSSCLRAPKTLSLENGGTLRGWNPL